MRYRDLSLVLLFLPVLSAQTDVLTYHNDNLRSGQYLNEITLSPANVNQQKFGKLFTVAVDGKVDAQPLYAAGVNIAGSGRRNVLYIATEHDSLYAADADTGAIYWHVQTLAAGETTSEARNGCGQVTPEIGITATPVIDRGIGANGAIYLVAMSKTSTGTYHQRLHALDLATGAELPNSPVEITATYPGTGDNSSNGTVVFDPKQYKSRPGLLLVNGIVYTSWSSHCDIRPYTGWVIGYDQKTLARTGIFNFAPNGSEASLWNSGAGPAADANGNLFFSVANGTFDTTLDSNGFPSKGDYGNAFVKLTANGGKPTAADYWTMFNTTSESSADQDLGSGGILLLPDLVDANGKTRHLAVGSGKDKNIYVIDRDNMGKYDPANDGTIYQQITSGLGGGEFGAFVWFNNTVYTGAVGDSIRAFPVSSALLATTPSSKTSHTFGFPGVTPSISANGTANGIVWAVENTNPAVLHAYDATDLTKELYNSTQAGSRDQLGPGNKYITPTIANGKVYAGTTNSVSAFGLLNQPPAVVSITPSTGTGTSQTFTAVFSDPNGVSDLTATYVLFGPAVSGLYACLAAYIPSTNALYLYNDAGTGAVSGSITAGTAGTLSNSQCTISSPTAASRSGNTLTLSLNVAVGAFAGSKNVYGLALNQAGAVSGWVPTGTWTPAPGQAPQAASVTPVNGSGSPMTFTAAWTEQNGIGDILAGYVLFNNSLTSVNGCLLVFVPVNNAIYLYNDAGNGAVSGSITPGTAGSISNSQCTISNAGSPAASPSSRTLSLPVTVTFAPSFTGVKNVYGFALNFEDQYTNWTTFGTWTR